MRRFIYMVVICVLLAPTLPAWGWSHGENTLTMAMSFGRAQITLQEVISNVEKTSGGRVVAVELEQKCNLFCSKASSPLFEVESVKDGTATKYFVDPVTGKIIEQKNCWWSALDFDSSWKTEGFNNIKMSMEQAVAAAEQATGGKAMSARLKERKGLLFYQVQTISEGSVKAVLIDPDNGKSYQAPQSSHNKCL
jgi:uncharacterized membrane protein YkoI